MEKKIIKEKIFRLVEQYHKTEKKKIPKNKAPISGKIYDQNELKNLIAASLEGWWTEGFWNARFEKKLKKFLGLNFCLTVNSGSSANLLAMKTLTVKKLGNRRIKKGDEVISVAAGFPTTINPIIQIGAKPVLVDVELATYNAKIDEIKKAISPKTKAIFIAHTLGNPFDLKEVKKICKKNKLWLVEDNCDALGSKYQGKYTGTFGDLTTISFYPAHHITTAEGGAVLMNNPILYDKARSIRDWGRDCWCQTGKDNTCKKRFSQQLGKLPYGYDHKFTFSEIGYNLKMTDLQAAIGVAQMDKLNGFIKRRKENFKYLSKILKQYNKYFILPQPTKNSNPSWFGFLLTITDKRIKRASLMEFLNKHNIGTRLLFGGNITRQPYFVDYKLKYRQIGNLKNTDIIMNNTFWIGVYPGLKNENLDHISKTIKTYIKNL